MKYIRKLFLLLPVFFVLSCTDTPKETNTASEETKENSGDNGTAGPKKILSGQGSLSFKLDNDLYQADPKHAKAWKSSQMPVAMLMASNGTELKVSMQLYVDGPGSYHIDDDKKGGVSVMVDGKNYGLARSTDYLDIELNVASEMGSLQLLSGNFSGKLSDLAGTSVTLSDGQFHTNSIK